MASFCKQCSIKMFGKDFEDLKGLTTEQNEDKDMFAIVICENCGPIQVNKNGECISYDCNCNGHLTNKQ